MLASVGFIKGICSSIDLSNHGFSYDCHVFSFIINSIAELAYLFLDCSSKSIPSPKFLLFAGRHNLAWSPFPSSTGDSHPVPLPSLPLSFTLAPTLSGLAK